MEIEILHGPGNPLAQIALAPRESCMAEGGALVAMKGNIGVRTTTHQKTGGGVFAGLKRKVMGESFFVNHFSAGDVTGSVWLAPTISGDLHALEVGQRGLIVQGGSFLCCGGTVAIDLGWQGLKSFFSGEGLFWIKVTGQGPLVMSSFGAIYVVDVCGDYVVDTGHIVAFEDSLDFSITKAGSSWIAAFLGGEGLVCKFSGSGRLWCQSHNPQVFGNLLGRFLPPILEDE